jgi:multimeric flavodoxin WrbA
MIAILWASPNNNGLTAACAHAAETGIRNAGKECKLYQLNALNIKACKACGNGWGTCREGHVCQVKDGFQALHEELKQAEALVLVTPVYWGDMAEVAKNFVDLLRRCEALAREDSPFRDMPMVAVAAAGGSGNGTVTCMLQMERLTQHMGMRLIDAIPVKRFTKEYQLKAIEGAAGALCAAIAK